EHLVAIADAWPPAPLQMLSGFAPASSLTWTLELVEEVNAGTVAPEGRFAYEVATDAARDGYAHTHARLWRPDGERVGISRRRGSSDDADRRGSARRSGRLTASGPSRNPADRGLHAGSPRCSDPDGRPAGRGPAGSVRDPVRSDPAPARTGLAVHGPARPGAGGTDRTPGAARSRRPARRRVCRWRHLPARAAAARAHPTVRRRRRHRPRARSRRRSRPPYGAATGPPAPGLWWPP